MVFEPAEEGGYVVTVPALPSCVTEGDTLEEAQAMAAEAIQGFLEALQKAGEEIPVEHGEPITRRIEVRSVIGIAKDELAGKSVREWMNELRGPTDLPPSKRR